MLEVLRILLNITDIRIYINSEVYPYDNLNTNFNKKQFAILHEDIQKRFDYRDIPEHCISPTKFV